MAKMSLADLQKLRAAKRNELLRRDPEGKDIQVIVGMGTCGLQRGAKKILEAFFVETDEQKLADKVIVRQSGCLGHCSSEPVVEVIVPDMPTVIYGNVDAAAVKEIVKSHIIDRKLLDSRIISRPDADVANT